MTLKLKEEIIKRMEMRNLSIATLERKAGLSIHSVRNILNGRVRKPKADTLQAVANALGCSFSDLFGNSSESFGHLRKGEIKIKNNSLLTECELMKNCFKIVLNIIKDEKNTICLDDCLDIVKAIYSYSLRCESKQIDLKFVNWIVDGVLDNRSSQGEVKNNENIKIEDAA